MQTLYNEKAPKKATNLSINYDLLLKARRLKINLSATLEQALRAELALHKANEWKKQNRIAISAYNDFVQDNNAADEA